MPIWEFEAHQAHKNITQTIDQPRRCPGNVYEP